LGGQTYKVVGNFHKNVAIELCSLLSKWRKLFTKWDQPTSFTSVDIGLLVAGCRLTVWKISGKPVFFFHIFALFLSDIFRILTYRYYKRALDSFPTNRSLSRPVRKLNSSSALLPVMYYVYVLYRVEHHKTCVGFTSDLASQLASHNSLATRGYTVGYRPWVLLYAERFETRKSAIVRERELKSSKGRELIKSLISQKYRWVFDPVSRDKFSRKPPFPPIQTIFFDSFYFDDRLVCHSA
jgi:putative endonuclease